MKLPQSCFSRAVLTGVARTSISVTPLLILVLIKYKAVPKGSAAASLLANAHPTPHQPCTQRRHTWAHPPSGSLGPALCLGGSVP